LRRRFFVEKFEGDRAVLRGEAAHHLGRVLRAEPGQLYELSDGQAAWLGRVDLTGRGVVEFVLVEPLAAREAALGVALLLAIVKFDRFEWCLEKAAELGAAEIVPLAAARSEKVLVAAAVKRARRWEKILLEAAQQSRRLCPPRLRPLARPTDAFQSAGAPLLSGAQPSDAVPVPANVRRIILSERPGSPSLRAVLASAATGHRSSSSEGTLAPSEAASAREAHACEGGSAVLAVGPEGGWTEGELSSASTAGFAEASLGANILRTETAVVAALAILQYALGDSGALV
jgi:16S rRNA (uracil1498-N3)-methyltransferase